MPANVDIAYPHSGDIVGSTIQVGGIYDAVGLLRKNAKGEPEPYREKDLMSGTEKIICKLYNSSEVCLATVTKNFAKGDPVTGLWSAQFEGIANQNDCVITATLEAGTEPVGGYPRDTVENVDVTALNVGGGVPGAGLIVLLPP
jgi:hypothetical protein